MVFFLWFHTLILRSYKNIAKQPSSKQKRSKKIFIATVQVLIIVAVFLGCNIFINLIKENSYVNNKVVDIASGINPEDPDANNSSNNRQDNKIDIIKPGSLKTNLADVAGLQEPKQEVQDVINYLKNPAQFRRLGAKPPKGIIMFGPPGTGKTYLARAIAGEANVTFISVSGSQFDQEYVGVGASRVRQLFQIARQNAPCIIFIDEIDSVAGNRRLHDTSSSAQTVNQLLTEMDGIDSTKNTDVIVIAASNRLDSIDQAILRPGRFDRQIKLDLPTIKERAEIINIHIKKIKIDASVSQDSIAKMTAGFSGAEIANLINEAAIIATNHNKASVDASDFEQAKDKIILGIQRPLTFTANEKRKTAYHEAGHTLVGFLMPEQNPVYKVTISPRGFSLGHTSFEPQDDMVSYSKQHLEGKIATALAGRLAEEIIFGAQGVTTGAENDLRYATDLAYKMVTKWGYSDKIGQVYVNDQENFIPKELIEQEVKSIIETQKFAAKKMLEDNIDKLHNIARDLIEKETLDSNDIKLLIENKS
jgi:cell division protease FtsH